METASIHSCKQDLELVEVQRYVSKKKRMNYGKGWKRDYVLIVFVFLHGML